jgi:hypothetical protein
MSDVPQNSVFITGEGQVDGPALNTFVQTTNTMASLRAFIGISGMQVSVLGQNAVNDGGGGSFYWNATGVAPDDNGVTTVVPYGSGSGQWTRLVTHPSVFAERVSVYPGNPTATTNLAGVMMGLGVTFTPKITGTCFVFIAGQTNNTSTTNGMVINLYFGTGTPPSNGAPLQGDDIVGILLGTAINAQFVAGNLLQNLTIGTTYWLDLGIAPITSGLGRVYNLYATVIEL